jgi:hypothetical protein
MYQFLDCCAHTWRSVVVLDVAEQWTFLQHLRELEIPIFSQHITLYIVGKAYNL